MGEIANTSEVESQTFRRRQGDTFVKFLDATSAASIFGQKEERSRFLDSITMKDALDWIVRINGIVRKQPTSERTFDGSGGLTSPVLGLSYLPPEQAARLPLLEETLTQIKTSDNKEYQDYALALAINLIHPFQNGNGRTSRIIASLIRDGYDGNDESQQRIKNVFTNRASINVNPSDIQELGYTLYAYEKLGYKDDATLPDRTFIDLESLDLLSSTSLPVSKDLPISQQEKENLVHIIRTEASFPIFFGFLQRRGQLEEFSKSPVIDGRTDIPYIDLDALLPTLNLTDIQDLIIYAENFRADYIHWMTDVFINPQSHMVNAVDGPSKPLADTFIKELKSYEKVSRN